MKTWTYYLFKSAKVRSKLFNRTGVNYPQSHFIHLLTRNRPEDLDLERVDTAFLDDLCRFNRDEMFFLGVDREPSFTFHAYLTKYLILYFDSSFDPEAIWDDYVRDFMWRHQSTENRIVARVYP